MCGLEPVLGRDDVGALRQQLRGQVGRHDAHRIFDALNWAQAQWPDMALATTGAKGGEKIAIKWAKQKAVTLVLAKADFDKNGRAAPFRANDELIALEPVCVLTLANTLNGTRAASLQPFGPALNLGQKAAENAECLRVWAQTRDRFLGRALAPAPTRSTDGQ